MKDKSDLNSEEVSKAKKSSIYKEAQNKVSFQKKTLPKILCVFSFYKTIDEKENSFDLAVKFSHHKSLFKIGQRTN